jgi:hypothetical protein
MEDVASLIPLTQFESALSNQNILEPISSIKLWLFQLICTSKRTCVNEGHQNIAEVLQGRKE